MLYGREWESLDYETERLELPNGWLVRYHTSKGLALCYVADRDKDWLLEDPKPKKSFDNPLKLNPDIDPPQYDVLGTEGY